MDEGLKINDAKKMMFDNKIVRLGVKRELYESVGVLTVAYGG